MRSIAKAASPLLRLTTCRLWLTLAGVALIAQLGDCVYDCGGYVQTSLTQTGFIQSPGYPGGYPNYTRCVWILEAPDRYTPLLSVDFQGEMYDGACSDKVEFRDGGPDSPVIQVSCGTMTSENVTSSGRWLYVYFSSDGFSQADGLRAAYTVRFVGEAINRSIVYPLKNCRSYEFECSNRLCVSMSYRCDGYYDCGCGKDCDEDGCGALSISRSLRLTIGFVVGISVFVLSAGFGLLLEKKHAWEKQRASDAVKELMSHPRRRSFQSSGSRRGSSRRGSNWNANKIVDVFTGVHSLRPPPRVDPVKSPVPSSSSPHHKPPAVSPTISVTAVV